MEIFQLDGRDRENYTTRSFYGVTNPFILPEHSGVRYYDIGALDGGHLLLMLNNAQWISSKQIHAARIKKGEIRAEKVRNRGDEWYPKVTPAAFEALILDDVSPSDDKLSDAIQTQFGLVLKRKARTRS